MINPHRQVRLRSENRLLTANVPDRPDLKVGSFLTLKDCGDPDRLWEVTYVSDHVNEKSALNRSWNNNI